ncbi:MAG: PilZ domain-containing protein [Desulfobulbaceae bacterium]|nr:PilZ domain-containing protein [Desulfobulbaceae bacterium]
MTRSKNPQGWHSDDSGYDIAESPEIINKMLATLQQKRMFLVLVHKGYQSGSTILVDHSDRHLMIDKPVDWPGTETIVRVVFKDSAKLWNHFTVKVLGVKNDLIYTTLPGKLSRLQRRAHFRVEAPRASRTAFIYDGNPLTEVEVMDISAGGMQVCSRERLPLTGDKDSISKITISLPGTADSKETTLEIRKGEVVRALRDEDKKIYCYGITFDHSQNEEELLLRYVRQRELELLRSGITL